MRGFWLWAVCNHCLFHFIDFLWSCFGSQECVFVEGKRAKTVYDSLHTTEEKNYVETQSQDRKY